MCDHNKRSLQGLSHQNKKAHAQDHHFWSRRDFMHTMGLSTSMAMLLGRSPLRAFSSRPTNFTGSTDRVTVMIRLAGGNDGLNTIIPVYEYSRYRSLRPNLAFDQNQLTPLSQEFAVPSTAQGFTQMWQEGMMKVVHGVGYPDQNLSHFRSTDIWSTASDANQDLSSGWLGRLITLDDPDITEVPPEFPAAIQIGNSGNLSFNNADRVNLSFNVSNTNQLFQIAEEGKLYSTDNLPDCLHGVQVDYVRQIANNTYRYADVIKEAYEKAGNEVEYSRSELADQLAIVARLIKGGLPTSFYLVTLNGFDTHANQMNNHRNLINWLSANVYEFYQDLQSDGVSQDRVLTMTTSEFGRRPQQNASAGTDHGAAAPMLLFGPELGESGFLGTHPDLYSFDAANNLIHTTDYRAIYQSIIENWMCFSVSDAEQVVGGSFGPIDLGLSCQATRVSRHPLPSGNIHMATQGYNHFHFSFELVENAHTQIQVFDLSGRMVAKMHRGQLQRGYHTFELRAAQYNLIPGLYIFTVRANRSVTSKKFVIH